MPGVWEKALLLLFLMFVLCEQCVLAPENPSSSLPNAPSAVALGSAAGPSPHGDSPDNASVRTSPVSRDDEIRGSPGHWVKRLLRDQADIYLAPFHESAVKWDVGLRW